MDHPDPQAKDQNVLPAQARGETVAYALQGGAMNLAANVFEPYIGYRIQKYGAGKDAAHGNYTQNLAGEIAGDLTGAGTLILAEAICPKQLHACSEAFRRVVDPLYSRIAKVALAREEGKPDYAAKVEQWKDFQEKNLVRSTIMAAGGIIGNLVMQKMVMGNPSPTGLIFLGKLASATLTTSVGLTARFAFPGQMKKVDSWMGRQIAPMMSDVQISEPMDSHAARIRQEKGTEAPQMSC